MPRVYPQTSPPLKGRLQHTETLLPFAGEARTKGEVPVARRPFAAVACEGRRG